MITQVQTITTILAMALVNYFTRASGVWLARRGSPPHFVGELLQKLPGPILISIIIPTLLKGGLAESVAALLTALTMLGAKNLAAATLVGVATVLFLRFLV